MKHMRNETYSALSVDQALSCIPPFLDASERDKLKEELPAYIAQVANVDRDLNDRVSVFVTEGIFWRTAREFPSRVH